MNASKLSLVISLLTFFIMVGGFTTWGYFASTDYFKGDQGLQGIQGSVGPHGSQGIQGIQGEQGEQGEKGDTGPVGLRGHTGPSGSSGVSAPVNHPPVIGLLNLSNCTVGKCGIYFLINVSITDVDADLLHAVIRSRFCTESDWKTAKDVYGFDGYASACVYSSLKKPVTCQWFIEVTDGSDQSVAWFNCTVG